MVDIIYSLTTVHLIISEMENIFNVFCKRKEITCVCVSVADPHRKNADADQGKNLNADADVDPDADSCPY
jgi:hypothetical protein